MTENIRRRTSKWDVVTEHNFPGEIRQDNALLVKADDLSKETELQADLNSLNPNGEQFSLWPDMKSDSTVRKDISQDEKTSVRYSELEDEIIRPSEGSSHMDESPKWAVMEQGDSKKSSHEPDSGNQTVKDAEVNKEIGVQDSAFDQDYNSGMSSGLDAWRRRSRNDSPRGWVRSARSRSRSRSRSWSRSQSRSRSQSPLGTKHGSERWSDRGRSRAGGQAPPCRDFAAGRCRRGSQCRFLHEDGGRGEFDRYHTHSRETKLERGRYSWHNGKENFTGSWDQTDYSQNKPFQRQRNHHDDGDREKPELHRYNKSAELCFDFTKGRCHRGSSCRYLHNEASSRGGDNYDRRDPDASFGQRIEPHRVSDQPCKYFAEGRCRRGQNCKFSHQGIGGYVEGKPHDGSWDYDGDTSSKKPSNLIDPTITMDTITPQWISGNDGVRSNASQSVERGNSTQRPKHQQSHRTKDDDCQTLTLEVNQKPISHVENKTHEVSGQHQHVPVVSMHLLAKSTDILQYPGNSEMLHQEGGGMIPNNAGAKPELNSANSMLNVAPSTGQISVQSGPSQFIVPHHPQAQSFAPNIQIPQAVAPLPFNEQMQQVVYPVPPNGQSQFGVPLAPSDVQHLNVSMQSQPVVSLPHTVQNQQNIGEQIQQNAPRPPHNGQSQQNLNLGGHNPQFLLPSMNGQSQHLLNPNEQIQQNALPPNGQSSQNIAPNLVPPQNGQSQETVQTLAPHKQSPPLEHPSENSFKSDNYQTSSQNISGEGSYARAGASEMKPSPISSASVISHKIVTSEQAARITDLSASLAQFFGNAPLNVSTLGMPLSQPSLGSSSAVLPASSISPPIQASREFTSKKQHGAISDNMVPVKPEINNPPSDPRIKDLETNSKTLLPVSVTDHIGRHENIDVKQVEPSSDNPLKEVNVMEAGGHGKNEDRTHLEDVDTDAADGESKQAKDVKGSKMFKYALVEFVKDLLKPTWKEGQLSREAHKTIVKKVVDKVTGVIQGPNIPQTQEKIDLYLVHSKSKLSKLVQAYVEKYVKN